VSDTRGQLVEMRERLIGNLGEKIEGGDLALLAAVNGALPPIRALALAARLIEAAMPLTNGWLRGRGRRCH
jgi:hypothetical protein